MTSPEIEIGSIGSLFLAIAALWARMEHRLTRIETQIEYLEKTRPAVRSGSVARTGRSEEPLRAD